MTGQLLRAFWRRVAQPPATGQDRYTTEQRSGLNGMMLTDDEVHDFQAVYEQLTGDRLSDADARDKATALLLFMHALTRPTGPAEEPSHAAAA